MFSDFSHFSKHNVLFHVLLMQYGKHLEDIITYTFISLKGRASLSQTNSRSLSEFVNVIRKEIHNVNVAKR